MNKPTIHLLRMLRRDDNFADLVKETVLPKAVEALQIVIEEEISEGGLPKLAAQYLEEGAVIDWPALLKNVLRSL